MPFAKLGLPLVTANILSLLIMTAGVYLLARHAPLKKFTIVTIVASGLFIYFLPVFARNYQIAVLGSILLCIFYKNRLTKPLHYGAALALTAQSHMLFMGFAATLGAAWALELFFGKTKSRAKLKLRIYGVALALASALIAILPTIGTISAHGHLRTSGNDTVYAEFNSIGGYLASLDHSLFGIQFTHIIAALFLLWLLLYFLARGKQKQFWILLVGIGFQSFVLAYIYAFTKHQQDVLLLLMMLTCYWIALVDSDKNPVLTKTYAKIIRIFRKSELVKLLSSIHIPAEAILASVFILTIPNTFYWAIRDLTSQFSVAPAAAAEINTLLPPGSTLITANGQIDTIALIPHLRPDLSVWGLAFNHELNYMIYDSRSTLWLDASKLKAVITEQLPNRKNLYYVSPTCIHNFNDPASSYLETLDLITTIRNENVGDDKITTERCFAVYRIN
jgi:hypothetical protein